MSLQKNSLTILLLTINNEKIEKFIKFHKNIDIIIFDGSPKPAKNQINFINYFHRPESGYFERLKEGLDLISTDYVMLGGDDEFYNLKLIMREISKNEDSAMIFGKCLEHYGLHKNSFREQYKNKISKKILSEDENKNINIYKDLLEEDIIYWYSAIKTNLLKKISQNFSQNNQMVEYEITLPFLVLNKESGSIKVVDGIWMKRNKYTRAYKPSELSSFKNIDKFSPIQQLAIEAKRMMYIKTRGERNEVIKIILKSLERKLYNVFYKIGLINPNYNYYD